VKKRLCVAAVGAVALLGLGSGLSSAKAAVPTRVPARAPACAHLYGLNLGLCWYGLS
jgi:hypothetical protein